MPGCGRTSGLEQPDAGCGAMCRCIPAFSNQMDKSAGLTSICIKRDTAMYAQFYDNGGVFGGVTYGSYSQNGYGYNGRYDIE